MAVANVIPHVDGKHLKMTRHRNQCTKRNNKEFNDKANTHIPTKKTLYHTVDLSLASIFNIHDSSLSLPIDCHSYRCVIVIDMFRQLWFNHRMLDIPVLSFAL
jgi:hypothetical protein